MPDLNSSDKQCTINDTCSYLGNPLITLENKYIKLTIMPEYGAKIFEFIYKPFNRNFLWENPRNKGRKAYYGANYDNFLTGGMEDAFPTGNPSTYKGDEIPFFGELWSVPWQYAFQDTDPDLVSVKLECFSVIYPVKVEKTVTLKKDDLEVNIKYKLINLSQIAVDYIWGIHPSIAIDNQYIIDLPEAFYDINVLQPGSYLEQYIDTKVTRFKWPNFCHADLRKIFYPADNTVINLSGNSLSEGCLKVIDNRIDVGFCMKYDADLFKTLSVWFIYGGWRGHYCIMAEPFTSWPPSLHQAVENKSSLKLEPEEIVETVVKVSVIKTSTEGLYE